MSVGWQDCEYGAPEINPKRPYGNSGVESDVAEILGWEVNEDEGLSDEQSEAAATLHRQTETALQIVLQTGAFEPGRYENRDKFAPYGTTWVRVGAPTDTVQSEEAP